MKVRMIGLRTNRKALAEFYSKYRNEKTLPASWRERLLVIFSCCSVKQYDQNGPDDRQQGQLLEPRFRQ